MGFKLGTERGNYAINGEIKTKMRFSQESGGDASVPGTPVIRKKLDAVGEANKDGSIFISDSIEPGSKEDHITLQHEMKHIVDMKTGKLSYEDDYITWNGEKYDRKDGLIKHEEMWFPEGHDDLPWEGH